MRRLILLAALSAVFLLALGGVAFADVDVTIGDDGLDPATVQVDIREPIVWTNATDADVSLVGEDPNWESGPIEPGATFSIEITQAGTYTYSGGGGLEGEIVVGDGGGNDPTDDPTEDATENTSNNEGDHGEDEPVEEIDPADEKMPDTGINAAVPAALSVLLIAFGGGLLKVTPRRRLS